MESPGRSFKHPLRYIALNKLKINNLVKPKSRLPYAPRSPAGGVLDGMISDRNF